MANLNIFIERRVSKEMVDFFDKKAIAKIEVEGWEGRNRKVKAENFAQSWKSESTWEQILKERDIISSYAGPYVGDKESAPPNFKMWFNKEEKLVGIRSRTLGLLKEYNEVPHPFDRFRDEPEKIFDFLVACSVENQIDGSVKVRFYGAIKKQDLMPILAKIKPIYSKRNQEYFLPIPLKDFSYDLMLEILDKADRMKKGEEKPDKGKFFSLLDYFK